MFNFDLIVAPFRLQKFANNVINVAVILYDNVKRSMTPITLTSIQNRK